MASRAPLADRSPSAGRAASPAVRAGLAERLNDSLGAFLDRAQRWAPATARMLAAVVLVTFGYQELLHPLLWTMYVPLLSPRSSVAEALVLAHGAVILVGGIALAFAVAPRFWALVSAVAMLGVLVGLAPEGYNGIFARDLGVLGLCLAIMGTGRASSSTPKGDAARVPAPPNDRTDQ